NKTAVKDDDTRKWMIGKDDFDYFRRKGTDMTIAEKRRDRFIKAIAGESTEWIDEHTVNGQLKYILRKFFPYHEDGKLKYIYGYGTDITEIKKGQIQRDVYLAQLEKMAFTTSHEIRHPICNLQGLISILEGLEFEGEEVKKIVGFMRISVNRMDDCTKDLATRLHEYRQNLSVANSSTELGR
ncbi:MAG TPA: hypothetical protein VF540_07550, partial [Segetibacter sp.]